MKRISAIVVLMIMLFVLVSSSVLAADQIRIGVATPSADHGWTAGVVYWAQKAIDDWEAKNPDLKFFYVTSSSPEQQVSQIEDLMIKDIDCLVILAYDSAPLTPIVEKVANEGVYVVSVDRGLTKPVEDIYVAGDNPGLGRVSAQYMADKLNGKGDIVVMEGIPCVINEERVNAFEEVMAQYPDIHILDSQPAYWQQQKGLEIMENYLQKYDHIDAVYAQDDDPLKGALQAYKESGRDDIKFFLGGAGAKDIIKRVMGNDPLIPADVMYPPSMIATGISMAVKAMTQGQLDELYQNSMPSEVILRSDLVTPKNAANYYEPDSPF